uniref:Uncharacterized protein n=1 Tax=Arundo donax TaxID=35708 RepID=A0A0A8ZIR8_ARUDO
MQRQRWWRVAVTETRQGG